MQNISCPVEEELEITLPEWPPKDSFEGKYPPLSRWLIKIISAENSRQIYTSEKNFTIHIKKNRPMCLTAYPITLLQDGNECRYFKPAGFIYPAQNDILSKKPSASWEQGFLADIMQQLFKEGIEENPVYLERFFRNLILGESNELKNRYTHIDYDEYIKKFGENEKSSEKKFGDNQKSSEIILELLKENPKLSAKKLSEQIGITSRAVEKQLASLVEKGLIKRKGSPKGGHWEVIE